MQGFFRVFFSSDSFINLDPQIEERKNVLESRIKAVKEDTHFLEDKCFHTVENKVDNKIEFIQTLLYEPSPKNKRKKSLFQMIHYALTDFNVHDVVTNNVPESE